MHRPVLVDFVEIDVEDGHLEVVGAVAIFVVDVDESEEFFAQIHFDAVVLLVARTDVDVPVVELLLQELLELDDFGVVQFELLRAGFKVGHNRHNGPPGK
jgi:hypothetical protein